jgi:hypothetical protein
MRPLKTKIKRTAKNVFNLLLQNKSDCVKQFSGTGSHYIDLTARAFHTRKELEAGTAQSKPSSSQSRPLIKTEPRGQLRGERRPSNFLCATGVQVFGGPILDEAGKNIAETVTFELMSQIPDLELSPIRQELERTLAEPGWA